MARIWLTAGLALLIVGLSLSVADADGTGGKKMGYNHLRDAASPYLRQHRSNPVDWYPWGPAALARAKKLNRPIFLSIGYSTCHWCHVMAAESFENPALAKLLNANFVCIKVDREERPDIDAVYMRVCQILTGRGGWPLNLFLTPDLRPFSAGTYIPQPTLYKVAERVASMWKKDPSALLANADAITGMLRHTEGEIRDDAFNAKLTEQAWLNLKRDFDRTNGGFGGAPKFPTPSRLMFLLRYWVKTQLPEPLRMVKFTLEKIRSGGIYDQLGSGFHRYSIDAAWITPHFEKMLYDQAMLTMAYTEVFQATGIDSYAATARDTIRFVQREMTSPDGVFYTAIDASEDYYLWTLPQLSQELSAGELELARKIYNIRPEGNFTPERGLPQGRNLLYMSKSIPAMAKELNTSVIELERMILQIRYRLYAARKKRNAPAVDKKIISGNNGLMIAALAKAAMAMGNQRFLGSAVAAADFIRNRMRTDDGGLYHCRIAENNSGHGMIDDYAAMIMAMLELYEATGERTYLKQAREWADYVGKHFSDQLKGGYFDTADNAEALLIRPRSIYDGPVPSGGTLMMVNLLRLASLTGNVDYAFEAEKKSTAMATEVNRSPENCTAILIGLMFAKFPPWQIIVVGFGGDPESKAMIAALNAPFCPFKTIEFMPASANGVAADDLHRMIDHKPTVYICRNRSCLEPVNSSGAALKLLGISNPVAESNRKTLSGKEK